LFIAIFSYYVRLQPRLVVMGDTNPSGGITLTIRLIRSFEHRNIKHLVCHNIDTSSTIEELMELINKDLKTKPGLPPPFRTFTFDTLKIEHKAHGAKTSDPIINRDNDEMILKKGSTIVESGIENETELSYFKLEDYERYKQNPEVIWKQ
ncbi:unnamed protein product, partial [Owenia fusiformis]